jgi:hypothetical protein
MLRLIFRCGECPAVFSGRHREHPATSWLDGIMFVSFGGLFGTAVISEIFF